ncbi:cytochrome P450 [Lysobacter silvisoli]|uniref:cytochrome P450 n=1 Tax=Lysobacter silvisoli TaxID=2293254 RepID=UPI001314FE77|nr:cytochrome P450 [Lysobacter silvisoli]
MKEEVWSGFEQDPLGFLDRELSGAGDIVRTGRNEYCVGNPAEARTVLSNANGSYAEHSDFFHTRYGYFEPRSAQLDMRREARGLLREYLKSRPPGELREFLRRELGASSRWPDTGNRLTYRYLFPLLLSPDRPQGLRALLDQIVERSVLAGARARQPRWRRMWLQFNTTWRLSQAIGERQTQPRTPPADLLDVVANAAEPDRRQDELSEVYLSFLFAVAGSVGFVLAWSLYLWGTHARRDAPAEWIVHEALRLWPVAWQLGRRPVQAHDLSGVRMETSDEVVVCPYLVQRNAAHWQAPAEFRPERWADEDAWRNPAFIPFGHGPHRCVAADLATQLVADMLQVIRELGEVGVTAHDHRPTVAAAMAPPPFTLTIATTG